MIKATRNQRHNINNSAQGTAKRVLTVCSASLLRSPSVAMYLNTTYGWNTRSCGTSHEYALVPISEALILWADMIVFCSPENYSQLSPEELACTKTRGDFCESKEIIILDIPDDYNYGQQELMGCIKAQFNWYLHMKKTEEQGDVE